MVNNRFLFINLESGAVIVYIISIGLVSSFFIVIIISFSGLHQVIVDSGKLSSYIVLPSFYSSNFHRVHIHFTRSRIEPIAIIIVSRKLQAKNFHLVKP